MSRIKDSCVREIKDLIDIVDVVGKYVDLKRKGTNYGACCPFHEEKTASFSVNPAKGIYKCFGCGEGGDAVEFLMKKDNKTYPEALEHLAGIYNIMLEYDKDDRTREEIDSERKKIDTAHGLMNTAASRYNRELGKHDDVMNYLLKKRLFTPDTILEWKIGYAPSKDFLAPDILKSKKATIAEDISLIGLFADTMTDCYRKRITFPIINHKGLIVGIGGRKRWDDENEKNPKYINSKDSFIYQKGKVLFGLHQAILAKAFKSDKGKQLKPAILTEGYVDVVSMHQCGYNNTVASCGTALTLDQARLLQNYTDSVIVFRDGDAAGLRATMNDIEVLLELDYNIYVVRPPESEETKGKDLNEKERKWMDPDDMCKTEDFDTWFEENRKDAVVWSADCFFETAKDELAIMQAIDSTAKLLARIENETKRTVYIESIRNKWKLKTKLQKAVANALKTAQIIRETEELKKQTRMELSSGDNLPKWVNKDQLHNDGFVQLTEEKEGYKIGLYFKVGDDFVKRYTNFTIHPLFHINDPGNNRRLVEVYNGRRKTLVEMPSRAFVSIDAFLQALIHAGNYTAEPHFTKIQFGRVAGWLSEQMPFCVDLKKLGWQPAGFWAFYNKIAIPDGDTVELRDYDDMGIVEVKGQHYISMGASSAMGDVSAEDNMYENDMYLSYVQSKVTLSQWAQLFVEVYKDSAPFGISHIVMTLFKDIVTAETKFPLLYAYGAKGSGKSEFSESLLHFFFSGKNSDGKQMQGYNLNPGQGTPFSFHNLMGRYRNCIVHFNEFDENKIEDWKFGSFKAFYDGQGREVGDGSSGKSRKTITEKPQGGPVIAGQFLSVGDDGSVLSRSICRLFNLSEIKNITSEQTEKFRILKELEMDGLSSLICDLLKYRNSFKANFKTVFWNEYAKLNEHIRKDYGNAEARLVKNYSACLAAIKLIGEKVVLPFNYDEFYQQCLKTVVSHNSLLKENNSLSAFWKGVEYLFDRRLVNWDTRGDKAKEVEFSIELRNEVKIKVDGNVVKKEFSKATKLIFIRFGLLYASFSKYHKERTGKAAQDETTLLKYLQDQPYYIGMCPSHHFDDKNTSSYVIDYEKADLDLEGFKVAPPEGKLVETTVTQGDVFDQTNAEGKADDLPF